MNSAVVTAASSRRHALRVLAAAIRYELDKATAFRTGFVVREVLRGVEKPLVMIAVYWAVLQSSGKTVIAGYSFPDLVRYLLMVAIFEKLVFHERGIDVAEQIFDGYLTKFITMPVSYYNLMLGRFVQFIAVQLMVAAGVYGVGAVFLGAWWPLPASAVALVESVVLVVLGSYCMFVVFFIINCFAFWLDIVWTLLVMTMFATSFLRGTLFPVAILPEGVQDGFHWLFPYWSLSGAIEIFSGRLGHLAFARGLLTLIVTALLLEVLRIRVWKAGLRNYSGSGM